MASRWHGKEGRGTQTWSQILGVGREKQWWVPGQEREGGSAGDPKGASPWLPTEGCGSGFMWDEPSAFSMNPGSGDLNVLTIIHASALVTSFLVFFATSSIRLLNTTDLWLRGQ
jgi:hypothetical protein